jgi:predicted RNase H-like nuclease
VVAGIDWHKRGWVAVVLVDGAEPEAMVGADLAALLARLPEARCVGVDMPIGLPERGARECDRLAKAFVGARRSSVFMTPPRAVLEAASFAAANEIAPALFGAKISQQAWALRHNIAIVEAVATDDDRVIEVHPEVSFRAMAGEPLAYAKTAWNGQALRRRLLREAGIELPDDLGEAAAVPPVDVLDAAAAAWSARRYANGEAASLPSGADANAGQVISY